MVNHAKLPEEVAEIAILVTFLILKNNSNQHQLGMNWIYNHFKVMMTECTQMETFLPMNNRQLLSLDEFFMSRMRFISNLISTSREHLTQKCAGKWTNYQFSVPFTRYGCLGEEIFFVTWPAFGTSFQYQALFSQAIGHPSCCRKCLAWHFLFVYIWE